MHIPGDNLAGHCTNQRLVVVQYSRVMLDLINNLLCKEGPSASQPLKVWLKLDGALPGFRVKPLPVYAVLVLKLRPRKQCRARRRSFG